MAEWCSNVGIRQCLFSAAISLVLTPAAASAEPPEQVLASYALRVEGDTWVLPEHNRLHRLLQRFEGQLRTFHKTEQAWREQIAHIDSLEKQLQQLETRHEESSRLLQQQGGNPLVQQQLQEQQGNLSKRIFELRLALKKRQNVEQSDLYTAARRHAAARAELLATTAAIDEAHHRLTERYESLAGSAAVQQALSDLRAATGGNDVLATAEPQQRDVEGAANLAAKFLATRDLPLLLSGGDVQLDALAAGKPTTFTLDQARPQTLIPLSHAVRLGISIGDAPLWQTLPYGDRKLRHCSVRLAALQVGDIVLRDVEVYVTAAEDSDLGLRLGTDVLDRIGLQIDRGRARIEVGNSPAGTHVRH